MFSKTIFDEQSVKKKVNINDYEHENWLKSE